MTTIECPITCRFVTFCSPAILKISFKAIISAKLFEPVPRHALPSRSRENVLVLFIPVSFNNLASV